MHPYTIIHNSISIDGSLTNFDVKMDLHYQIAGIYKPDIHLIGSNTIKKGIDLYGHITPERKIDFKKTIKDKNSPYWVIIDSTGKLKGLLHEIRKFKFCRDIIVLISKTTPVDYIQYLDERNYDYYITGEIKINLKKSFDLLLNKYKSKKILVDTGRILGNILINQGFVNEISLLIHPVIVGKKCYNMFANVDNTFFKLDKCEILEKKYIWQVYKINSN